ncbi:hypothetical protein FRX31_028647 [Thalictrum thalictroides]|uniref:Uncharacterized protein n=1 Tax=Thalictrum thalictroides TaxID=46969 RepID=A0A7J6V9P5_THATH|nr:hypothetical protein FRX31_028647 [Thalictrum thalictroides]
MKKIIPRLLLLQVLISRGGLVGKDYNINVVLGMLFDKKFSEKFCYKYLPTWTVGHIPKKEERSGKCCNYNSTDGLVGTRRGPAGAVVRNKDMAEHCVQDM